MFCISSLKSLQFVLRPSQDNLLTIEVCMLTERFRDICPHVADHADQVFQLHCVTLHAPIGEIVDSINYAAQNLF